jgi:hypothetical protein
MLLQPNSQLRKLLHIIVKIYDCVQLLQRRGQLLQLR